MTELPEPIFRRDWREPLRWLLLLGAAIAVHHPYIHPGYFGGVDARWYATMLRDYLHQLRAGHWPVLLGQGPLAWNGGVHPFRSAPVFMWLSGLIDLATLGRCQVFLIQHLSVFASAAVGTWGAYGLACWFMPARRWAAACLAGLYLMTPAWVNLVLHSEAYMSYMAFMALPLILYGNLRAARKPSYEAYRTLAAGLAWVWMCHPPIAMISTLASIGVQAGVVVFEEAFPFVQAVKGLLWFPFLGAFYFLSMSEVPKPDRDHPLPAIIELSGFFIYFFSAARCFLQGKSWRWLIVAGAGYAMIFVTSEPWRIWVAIETGLLVVLAFAWPRAFREGRRRSAYELMLLTLLLASMIAMAVYGMGRAEWDPTHDLGVLATRRDIRAVFWPLPTTDKGLPLDGYPTFGPALLALLGLSIGVAVWSKDRTVRLLLGAAVVFGVSFCGFPMAGRFLIGYFPRYLGSVANLGLSLRFMPVWASVAFAAGVASWARLPKKAMPWAWAGLVLLVGLEVTYTTIENRRWAAPSEQMTERNLLPENLALTRYAYDLLPKPSYFTDGTDDPRLQVRLIDAQGNVLVGPVENAKACEGAASHTSVFRAGPYYPGSKNSMRMEPHLVLAPRQRLVIRFAFVQDRPIEGWLLLFNAVNYREYLFPTSGFEHSFGSAPGNTPVMMIDNSTEQTQDYEVQFVANAGSWIVPGAVLGTVTTSTWMPDKAPASLLSLEPFTAGVDAKRACFLESCRAYLPDYEATVDGQVVDYSESKEHQIQVPVPAGKHTVILRPITTARIRLGFWVSVMAWLALMWIALRPRRA